MRLESTLIVLNLTNYIETKKISIYEYSHIINNKRLLKMETSENYFLDIEKVICSFKYQVKSILVILSMCEII